MKLRVVMLVGGILMLSPAFVRPDTYASEISWTNLSEPPASITVIAGSPQSAQVNTVFPIRFRVLVRDSVGNPVPGVTVTWTPPVGGPSGTFAGGINTALTDSSGKATSALFIANLIAGSYVVLASAPGIPEPAIFYLRNLPGPPISVTPIAGTPQSARVNTLFPILFKVLVQDAAGNPVAGVTAVWVAPITGPSGRFEGTVGLQSDSTGIVTAPPFRANSIAGSYVVTASVAGVSVPAQFFLTNLPGPPASIAATAGTPQTTQVNTLFPTPFAVLVRDSFSNPVPGVTVTWAPPARGASGTFILGTNTAVTNANGIAIARRFMANDTVGTYTVPATVQGFAATALFILTNTGTLVVENETSNLMPDRFALQQNYPNPFNPTTRIEYSIPKTIHESLKVFDVMGREVATLVDEVQGPGFKNVEFNASELASGVYFYRLTAGSFVETKKLMIVR